MKHLTLTQRKTLLLVLLALWLMMLVYGIIAISSLWSRYQLFNVASGSMEPALSTSTIIAVAKNNGTLYAPGDIITYKQDGIYITHRIIELGYNKGFYYRTQGDANQDPDPGLIKHQEIFGQVVFTVPAFFTPLRRILNVRSLLLFPVLLFAALYLKKNRKVAARRPLHN
ncbi:MAG TPA: signal peptidase I [Oscillospiraceae bacterium]|nr:signal peptidase I [Oscillospiraceae bacterium]